MDESALSGVRVADFSRVLAGPLVTMTLGDLGADVIKVEPPRGDDTRQWGPPHAPDGNATYFLAANRNKRSLVLDLKSQADRETARRLIRHSDVLVENFRPGVMDRLGFGWEDAHKLNPNLIYCSISGFGREAGAGMVGYDAVIQAVGGLMSVTGTPDADPVKAGVAVVDVLAGLNALTGILAALHARQNGMGGQRVDVSLLNSVLSALANHSSAYLNADVVPARVGNAHPSIEPYSTFPTADGTLMLCVGNDRQFVALCGALGMPGLATDTRFATNEARVSHRDELRPVLVTALAGHDRRHWTSVLSSVGVPCGSVNDLADAFRMAESLGLKPIDRLDGFASVRSPIGLSATPPRTRLTPPHLDEHGPELRAWLDGPTSTLLPPNSLEKIQ
ncbi:CoA transferase [Streptomyces sp. DSM 41524]|uniref:CoA transferase n=2 Tax=Streptomyces TaxID=1883 RepID=A0ABU7QC62_9ACTN|nr:CoA transferase [Streptomyces sp. DSM 41524]